MAYVNITPQSLAYPNALTRFASNPYSLGSFEYFVVNTFLLTTLFFILTVCFMFL